MPFRKLFQTIQTDLRKMFLIDGIGALVSAFLLGIILTMFQEYIGMPTWILTILSLIALLFAIYSLNCFFWVKQNQRFFLRIIACFNFSYCLITAGMLVIFRNQLTLLGFTYFLGEIIFILGLVFLEFNLLKQKTPL